MRARITTLVLALAVAATLPPATSHAAAPGCTDPNRPTSITGNIYGGGDNYSVGAQVNMDLLDASGQKVDAITGAVVTSYSYTDDVNPSLTAAGTSATTGYERRYGAKYSDAPLCIHKSIVKGYFEIYPKTQGVTDKVRYGSAAEQALPITPGVANVLKDLRPPLRSDVDTRGNTGSVNGYITFNGGPLPLGEDWKIKVFPVQDSGQGCGIHAFSANSEIVPGYSDNTATVLDEGRMPRTSAGTSNYYVIDALAAGQCGAASQQVNVRLTRAACKNCAPVPGGVWVKTLNVVKNTRPRIDFAV